MKAVCFYNNIQEQQSTVKMRLKNTERQLSFMMLLTLAMDVITFYANASRTVLQNSPIVGENIYPYTFDCQIPSNAVDDTKLSKVKFCVQDFYTILLGTYISLEWSDKDGTVLTVCEQYVKGQDLISIDFDNNPNCDEHTVSGTGEIGQIEIMLAGSDQIQGIRLLETDTSTYTTTQVTLGSVSAGNPVLLHLDGPIIGLYGSYELQFDGLNFFIDETYCHRSKINAFTLVDQSTILGERILLDLTPSSGAKHQLGASIYARDPCTVQYDVETTQLNLLTIPPFQSTGYIGQKWIDNSASILGTEVAKYTGWQIKASYALYPSATYSKFAQFEILQTFNVDITPACAYSQIIQTNVIQDMTIPYFSKITQTLPTYSHQHAVLWGNSFTEACTIATRVDNGGSVLRKDPDDTNAIQAYTYTLSDENTEIEPTITAYYSDYPDSNPPPSSVFHKQEIKVTIEKRCDIKQFYKGQDIPQTTYVVNSDGPVEVPILFIIEEACNLQQYYTATVSQGGVLIATPSFLSFDDANNKLLIESIDSADVGFYQVSISSQSNLEDPNQLSHSTDTIDFTLVMADTLCLKTDFIDETIQDMTYYIDQHSFYPSGQLVQIFNEFTDTVTVAGTSSCGNRIYELTWSDPIIQFAVTMDTQRELSVSTTDMSLLGSYEVYISISLETYPELTPVIGIMKTVTIKIDHRCLHTSFYQSTPIPIMVHQVSNSAETEVSIAEIKDDVSLAFGLNDGLTYCGEREYSLRLVEIGRFTNSSSTLFTIDEIIVDEGPLILDQYAMSLKLFSTDHGEIGRYKYQLVVNLREYESSPIPIDRLGSFPFYVFVIHDCTDSQIIGDDLSNIVVTVNQKQAKPIYFANPEVAVSSLIEILKGTADYCGPVKMSVELQDNVPIPEYMIFDDNTNSLQILPTSNDQVGQYQLVLKYKLEDYPSHSYQNTFKVVIETNLVNHMPYLSNIIGFQTKISIAIDDVFNFPIQIVDPDQDSLELTTVSFYCNPAVDSFSYQNLTADSSSFTFNAKRKDAGHTFTIQVQIQDQELSANYTWKLFVQMPTIEQEQEVIKKIIAGPSEEVILVSDKLLNEVQQDFFALNSLPVVNPRDIQLLKDLKQYPLPYVESIDRKGMISVKFSRAIANCNTEEEREKMKLLIRQGVRMELISGDTEELIGTSGPVKLDQSNSRRLNETFGMTDQNDDVLVDWEIQDLDSLSLTIKFSLKDNDATLTNENNKIKIIFEKGENYLVGAEDGKSISKNDFYVTRIVVPRQLPSDSATAQNIEMGLAIAKDVVDSCVIVVFTLSLLFDLPLTYFWIILSSFALVSHVAVSKVIMHAYTELSYEVIMEVIRLNFFNQRKAFDDWLFEKYEFTSTGVYNTAFYTMGYTSKNVISNIGTINVVFVTMFFLSILIQLTFWPKSCSFFNSSLTLRCKKFQPQTFLIRFFLIFYVVLGISALILMKNSDQQDGFDYLSTDEQGGSDDDQSLEVFSLFVIVFLIVVLITTITFSLTQARKLHKIAWLNKISQRTTIILHMLTGSKPIPRGQQKSQDEPEEENKPSVVSKLARIDQIDLLDINSDYQLDELVVENDKSDTSQGARELNMQIQKAIIQQPKYLQNLNGTKNPILIKYLSQYLSEVSNSELVQRRVSDNYKQFYAAQEQSKQTQMDWTDIEQYQFFVEYLKGMRTDSAGVISYYCIYLIRRTILIFALAFMHDDSGTLMQIWLLLTLLSCCHLSVIKHPFSSMKDTQLDWFCEVVLYLACIIQLSAHLAFNSSTWDKQIFDGHQLLEYFGLINFSLLSSFVTVLIIYMLVKTFRQIYYIVRKHRKIKQLQKAQKLKQAEQEEEMQVELKEQRQRSDALQKDKNELMALEEVEQKTELAYEQSRAFNTSMMLINQSNYNSQTKVLLFGEDMGEEQENSDSDKISKNKIAPENGNLSFDASDNDDDLEQQYYGTHMLNQKRPRFDYAKAVESSNSKKLISPEPQYSHASTSKERNLADKTPSSLLFGQQVPFQDDSDSDDDTNAAYQNAKVKSLKATNLDVIQEESMRSSISSRSQVSKISHTQSYFEELQSKKKKIQKSSFNRQIVDADEKSESTEQECYQIHQKYPSSARYQTSRKTMMRLMRTKRWKDLRPSISSKDDELLRMPSRDIARQQQHIKDKLIRQQAAMLAPISDLVSEESLVYGDGEAELEDIGISSKVSVSNSSGKIGSVKKNQKDVVQILEF